MWRDPNHKFDEFIKLNRCDRGKECPWQHPPDQKSTVFLRLPLELRSGFCEKAFVCPSTESRAMSLAMFQLQKNSN